MKILRDASTSEDIVQEVFVNIWSKRDKISVDTNLKSYLFQSTRNKAIEYIRKRKLDQKHLPGEHPVVFQDDMDQESEKYLLKEKIYNSIRQLPPKCQQIFKMSKISGLTYNEIAEDLNISVKTVENQISRGLKLIREMLK